MKAANATQTRIVPFKLEVYPFKLDPNPVVPFQGFNSPVFNENCLSVLNEIGVNGFLISPYMLRAEFDDAGHLTKSWIHPKMSQSFSTLIRLTKDMVKQKKCFFMVGYSSYLIFYKNILKKKIPGKLAAMADRME